MNFTVEFMAVQPQVLRPGDKSVIKVMGRQIVPEVRTQT